MAANNEILGVLQPLAAIGKITSPAASFPPHDAAQIPGKLPSDVEAMGIDLLLDGAQPVWPETAPARSYYVRSPLSGRRAACRPSTAAAPPSGGSAPGRLNNARHRRLSSKAAETSAQQ